MTFRGQRLQLLLLIFFGIPLLCLAWIGLYAISPGPLPSRERIEVYIPPHTSLSGIRDILAEHGVIRDDIRFFMLAMLSGTAAKLRAGEYGFRQGTRPLDVIDHLKTGRVLYRPVTIPEGTETAKVAEILAAGGWVEPGQFLKLAHDQEFIRKLGVNASSLEGYLFPDTYYLSKGQQNEAVVIKMMVEKHLQVYRELAGKREVYPQALTHHGIVTLASIVEKETGVASERPLVASVFFNRLAKGMRLQSDPTVRYGIAEKPGPLTRGDLARQTPYNTYIIEGLPPGPISNPGRAAIEAVLNPADTDYLYFVSKNDDSHYFSRTLQEHNRAVFKYRQGK